MAKLFERNFPLLNLYTKYTEMVLKNTWIKVFPTTAIKDLRGYFSAKYIFIDESDFFPESVQQELQHAINPYQLKSNCKIIMASTPNAPNGLMQQIELDKDSKYFKLKLPYSYGLDRIYNRKDVKPKMHDIEFEREFNCKYLGKVGNLISQQQLEHIIELGKQYTVEEIPVSLYTAKACGVDWGFSSSASVIVCLEHMTNQFRGMIKEDIIRVTDCILIEKGTPDQVINECWNIHKKYGFMNTWFYCDASNAGMINQMKVRWSENLHWRKVEDVSTHNNKIMPVAFQNTHKEMLSHLLLIASKGLLAINPKYDKLITSLRTAWAEEFNLKKDVTSYDDLFDALRLGLISYKFV